MPASTIQKETLGKIRGLTNRLRSTEKNHRRTLIGDITYIGPSLNRTRENELLVLTKQYCMHEPNLFPNECHRINRWSTKPGFCNRKR